MLSRKEQSKSGNKLPSSWENELVDLLSTIYSDNLKKCKKTFKVFGRTFPNELLIAVSLLDPQNEIAVPVTYLVSMDIDEQTKYKKGMEVVIDSIGPFFDSFFSTADWNEYNSNWTEIEYKGQTFYYKVSRENVELTLKADEILGD